MKVLSFRFLLFVWAVMPYLPDSHALLSSLPQQFSTSAAATTRTASPIVLTRPSARPFNAGSFFKSRMTAELIFDQRDDYSSRSANRRNPVAEKEEVGQQQQQHRRCRIQNAEDNTSINEDSVYVVSSSTLRAASAVEDPTTDNLKKNFGILTVALLGSIKAILVKASSTTSAASFLGTANSMSPLFRLLGAATTFALPMKQFAVLAGLVVPTAVVGTIKFLTSGYMTLLDQNPIITKSITAGVIGVIGDFMAQKLEGWLLSRKNTRSSAMRTRNNHKYDRRRGFSILIDGLIISGPLMHLAYELFENVMPSSSSSWAAMSHVLADSILLDSIFVATTFVVTGLMEGYTHKQLIPQMKKDYKSTLMASWVTSIGLLPLEFVCFRYLPVPLRVLAVNCIDVIWDTVVSFFAHRNRKQDEPRVVEEEQEEPALLLEGSRLEAANTQVYIQRTATPASVAC